jgi:hypothetical protein
MSLRTEHTAITVDRQQNQHQQPFYASNFRATHLAQQMRGLILALVVACYVFFNWEFYKSYVFTERSSVPAATVVMPQQQ